MSEHDGLSQLADTARDLTRPREACYPIRRKGEKRRLNPNQAGIDWLEGRCTDGEDFLGATEIAAETPSGEVVGLGVYGEPVHEYKILRAHGGFRARRRGLYVRPIFQTLHIERGSAQQLSYPAPCPDCDDWSRTSRCAQHHDRDGIEGLLMSLKRGAELRRTLRPPSVPVAHDVFERLPRPGNVTIEVNGETVQGVRNFSYEIEREHGRETVSWRL